jgi:hypothetical protein
LHLQQLMKSTKRNGKNIGWRSDLKKLAKFTHKNLLKELELTAPSDYKNLMWMEYSTSMKLLDTVTPFIQKRHHCDERCNFCTSKDSLQLCIFLLQDKALRIWSSSLQSPLKLLGI